MELPPITHDELKRVGKESGALPRLRKMEHRPFIPKDYFRSLWVKEGATVVCSLRQMQALYEATGGQVRINNKYREVVNLRLCPGTYKVFLKPLPPPPPPAPPAQKARPATPRKRR